MRVALYVIIVFLMYLADELTVIPHFWIGILGFSGIVCLYVDYSKSKKRKKG